ncbi:hypothetical protein J3A83DRAFT_2538083 [Scleroderma citrinum]
MFKDLQGRFADGMGGLDDTVSHLSPSISTPSRFARVLRFRDSFVVILAFFATYSTFLCPLDLCARLSNPFVFIYTRRRATNMLSCLRAVHSAWPIPVSSRPIRVVLRAFRIVSVPSYTSISLCQRIHTLCRVVYNNCTPKSHGLRHQPSRQTAHTHPQRDFSTPLMCLQTHVHSDPNILLGFNCGQSTW